MPGRKSRLERQYRDGRQLVQRIDHRAVRHLDPHRHSVCRAAGRQQPVAKISQARTAMWKLSLSDDAALCVDKALWCLSEHQSMPANHAKFSSVMAILPTNAFAPATLSRSRRRSSCFGLDDRRDAYVLAAGVLTDRRLFRRVPRLVELRAWSRLAEELTEERVRLSNRVHHELWRYYPQLLQVSDDLTEPWVLDLWDLAPTPAKAGRLRAAPIEKLLRQHRIRRTNADTVLRIWQELPSKLARAWWRQPASTCVRCLPGCVSSTANCDGAGSQLDALCAAIGDRRDRCRLGRGSSTTRRHNPQIDARHR